MIREQTNHHRCTRINDYLAIRGPWSDLTLFHGTLFLVYMCSRVAMTFSCIFIDTAWRRKPHEIESPHKSNHQTNLRQMTHWEIYSRAHTNEQNANEMTPESYRQARVKICRYIPCTDVWQQSVYPHHWSTVWQSAENALMKTTTTCWAQHTMV